MSFRIAWIASVFLFTLAHPCSPLLTLGLSAQGPTVRVAILEEVDSARVTLLASCRVTDLKTGKVLAQYPALKWQEVKSGNPGVTIGREQFPSQALLLLPDDSDGIFHINAKPYRGALILYRAGGDKLTLINRLELEEYLVGALTSEVKPDWPVETLKAHAVVSRTMVAHRIWINREKPFDVTSDTRTHLYYGVRAERDSTRQAVEETSEQVLAYEGELFSATFHANCGGHTEEAAEIWSVKWKIPPLSGVKDPYCRNLKHYSWRTRMSARELLDDLKKEVSGIGVLTDLEVLERNRSGRVRLVKLVGSQRSATLTGRRFRELLGANHLRSLNFTVEFSPHAVQFRGYGWGHGVGLCQWGAYGMARRGKTMDEILALYFPDAQRRKLQGLPGFS